MNEDLRKGFSMREPQKAVSTLASCTSLPVYVVLVSFLVFGCATTRITSIIDREFPPVRYSRILVLCLCGDLELEQRIEAVFCERLEKEGVEGFDATEYWFPFKSQEEFTDEDVAEVSTKLENDEVGAILWLRVTDAWTDYSYFRTPTTVKTKGSAQSWGDGRWFTYQSKSYVRGGSSITVAKLRKNFRVQLQDLKSGEVIWFGTAKTRGGKFAGLGTLLKSLASGVVDELKEWGFIVTESTGTEADAGIE